MKHASNEEYQQEDKPFSQQDFKWRKAHHRKEQARELVRVEVAEEELREHVRSSLEKLEERERALNNRERRLEEDETKFAEKWFGSYKHSRRFQLLRFRFGPIPAIEIGTQTNLDEPDSAPEDTFIYPTK